MTAGSHETQETAGRDDRILPWPEVQSIAGISRATAWRMQKTGDFPDPVPISPNRVGWWESELTAWKAARKADGRKRPAPFAKPRAPKLLETARSTKSTKSEAAVSGPEAAPGASVQANLDLQLRLRAAPTQRRTRSRGISPDQFDFGF